MFYRLYLRLIGFEHCRNFLEHPTQVPMTEVAKWLDDEYEYVRVGYDEYRRKLPAKCL